MLPEEDSMDEIEKAYKIMDEEGDVSRTLERPKQVKSRKKTDKPKHKEQMLQTLDVEQSKAPKNTTKQKTEELQEQLEQTVDQPKNACRRGSATDCEADRNNLKHSRRANRTSRFGYRNDTA